MPRRAVAVSLVMALALLGDSLLYVVLPLNAAALGLSAVQVGVLLSANRFVRMLTNKGAAGLMRRVAPGHLFAGATALGAVTTALYALTPAFLPFLAARMLWGLCFSALRLACFMTVLATSTDRTRGRVMGGYQSISRAGSFVAVMAGGLLFDVAGYHAAILAMAGGTALALPLALRTHITGDGLGAAKLTAPARRTAGRDAGPAIERGGRPPDGVTARRVPPARGLSWVSPTLAVKWSAFTLSFVARGVVTATLAVFLKGQFGDSFGPGGLIGVATIASWLIGVRWASDIGLAAPLGALSDRVGRAPAAVAWLSIAAIAVLVIALAPALSVAVGAAVALFVAASGLSATLDAAMGDLAPPARRARAMTSYADWTDMGAALGPLIALSLSDMIGLRPSYLAGAALLASGGALIVASLPMRRRSAAVARSVSSGVVGEEGG